MALTIQFNEKTPQPTVACDHCGDAIHDANNGMFVWHIVDQAHTQTVQVVHKGACLDALTATKSGTWGTEELASLPALMAASMGITMEGSAFVTDQTIRCQMCTGLLMNYPDMY